MGILDIFKACAKNRESSDTLSRDNYSAWISCIFKIAIKVNKNVVSYYQTASNEQAFDTWNH